MEVSMMTMSRYELLTRLQTANSDFEGKDASGSFPELPGHDAL